MNHFKCLYLFIFLISFLSCSETKKIDNSLVFRYNEHKNIGSLDPAFSKDNADTWATNQLFNGLLEMDDNLNVLPSIAKSYTISEDALNYTFTLRKDVYFHESKWFGKDSTRTVNAYDFEYSFNRLLDPKIASPGRWVLNKVKHFNAENDSTFAITLKQPFPAFLGLLTMKYCSVVPKEVVEHYGSDLDLTQLEQVLLNLNVGEENIKLVLRKNHNYFQSDKQGNALPYLEAVAITFLPDKQSEYLQFVQGNLDFLNSLDASYQDDLLTIKGTLRSKYKSNIDVIRGPYLNTEYLAFYLDSELTEIQSELLRKAINFGFDREKMMLYLRNGIGIPATGGFIPKGLPGYRSDIGYTYQPEKAKQLIDQFKTETGVSEPQITITTTSNYLNFCEFIQREINKIGLTVSVDVIPASTLKSAKANGKLDVFRASWVADYPDAENYLSLFSSDNFAPSGPNYTHFKNETFNTWFESAYLETNTVKREKLYTKMDSLVMSKAPIVPLYYDEVIRFTRKNVKGFGINATNLLDLRYVKKIN